MKMNKYFLAVLVLMLASIAWAAKPIHNIVDEAVPVKNDGSGRTADEVKEAMIAGCKRRSWSPVIDRDAQINQTCQLAAIDDSGVASKYQ